MEYTPDKKSISQHEVPDWFHDAKFGIFIHWGLYSVPAFAVKGIDITETMDELGIEEQLKNNTYAEWYLNSLRIPGSPTEKHHKETYGNDFIYDDFVPIFNREIQKWNPKEMVEIFKKAGAKYVVLTTKHHDGFTLWKSKFKNPNKDEYCASRDIVEELTNSVKKAGLKMGLYYSGILDWSFQPNPIKDAKSFLENGVTTPEYTEYANNHWYELINNYEPIILWNDIAYPPNTNVYEIFAYFYNKFPEGVINDRWQQASKLRHKDFKTPEYQIYKNIKKRKWETCRGIGNSFGYNKVEDESDYLTSEELIRMLIDIVSKNGNLLLNVGPKANGTIPEIQVKSLLGLGKWLEINAEAIYGTRPWSRAEGKTLDGIDVRFTQNQEALFIHLLDNPKGNEITLESLVIDENSTISLLGKNEEISWTREESKLKISLPENSHNSSVLVFKIIPKPLS